MSRLIVKNIPKFMDEQQLTKAFNQAGTVTDCKIITKNGQSRRFAFIGYKDQDEARKAQKYFNRTYLGTSRIQVEMAKTKDQLLVPTKTPKQKKSEQPRQQSSKKFQEYKSIIEKGSKQSWNDLLVGEDTVIEPKKMKKDVKKEKVQTKNQEKTEQLEKTIKKEQTNIKPPKLSEKNEKYVSGPLKVDTTRLYVTNFPKNLPEQEITNLFSRYGVVVRTKLPKDNNQLKGYGFVTFEKSEEALRAFSQLDNKIVFGRILHIKPALQDIGTLIKTKKQEEYQQMIKDKYGQEDKTSYKKKKKAELRRRLDDTTSWNTLFLNPNTLLEHMAQKHNITKSQILLSDNLAVKMALIETEVIDETKDWMKSQGLNLEFLETDRNLCERSKTIILVKNLNYNAQKSQIQEEFGYYGIVQRVLLCPNKTIAIVEFQSEQFAKNAFQKLSYAKFKGNPLYLQWAPVNLMTKEKVSKNQQKLKQQEQEVEELGKVLYIKNINFQTKEDALRKHFIKMGNIKSVKIIVDREGKSMGYAFIEFSNKQQVLKAIKTLQNSLLDGHLLQLSVSKKTVEQNVNRRKKQQLDFTPKLPKLVVRNVAFEATKQDVRQLFKEFGTVKSVRLPKKMDGQHRGFAFVEFQTLEEAMQAFSALSNSHLYGRKLVVEWQESAKS